MNAIEEIKTIKKEELGLITVLTGDDLGQFQLAKSAFLKQIAFDTGDLSYTYFDMSESDYTQVDLDLVSLPFFSDEKFVILDYFSDLTTDKKRYLTDDELKQFESYLEYPVDSTHLVIFAQGKLDNKRRLVKLLKRDARIIEANAMKEKEFKAYFQKEVARLGLQMKADVFEELLIRSNLDFSEMTKNLAFLQSYKVNSVISHQDIHLAIPKSLQDNLFDLTQLILSKKINQAQSLVHDLRLQGEDEIKLLAVLLTQFRLYLQVQLLVSDGQGQQQIIERLSDIQGRQINPYQVKFALRDSRDLSIDFLKKVVQFLIETDYQIKTGLYEKDFLFDIVLLRIANLA